jgi:XRE family transcriptional regulator
MNIKNNNLRKIRREKDLTQEYIAFELGISQKTYSDIENGKTKINQQYLEKIASILKVPTSDICDICDISINCNIFYRDKYYKILEYLEQENIVLPNYLLE